jgi:3-dehydro-L-gulonate 2-dehydrogenase
MGNFLISYDELQKTLKEVLVQFGFPDERADQCAHLFAKTDLDGVRSHGINRFPVFLKYIEKGYVNPHMEPFLESSIGVFERWDGQLGPGNLNANFAMSRALEISESFGIGCVALRQTNHWMRGGNFGWQAIESGKIGICFTNTKANMPAWGGSEPKLGNNPLIVAIPRKKGPIVLDMAMSQFAYGKLSNYARAGKNTPYEAGFDTDGNLTKDPNVIIENEMALPAGMWKGAGLSLVLDLLASILSGGDSTHEVDKSGVEKGLSQVFLALDPKKLELEEWAETKAESIIQDLKSSQVFEGKEVFYPGENVLRNRQMNLDSGIPVNQEVWNEILKFKES